VLRRLLLLLLQLYLILVSAAALLSVFWNKARIRFFTSEPENSSASGPLASAHLRRGTQNTQHNVGGNPEPPMAVLLGPGPKDTNLLHTGPKSFLLGSFHASTADCRGKSVNEGVSSRGQSPEDDP